MFLLPQSNVQLNLQIMRVSLEEVSTNTTFPFPPGCPFMAHVLHSHDTYLWSLLMLTQTSTVEGD